MLKSLFESSIDRLNIPSGMKTAIKQINNICLEAEGDETSKNVEKAIGNVGSNTGMFNQHMSAEEAKARYDAQQKEKAAKEGQNDAKSQTQVAKADEKKEESAHKNSEDDNVPTTIDDAKSNDDIWKVLKNLQQKAVKNRGTEEGENWRQKLEEEYQKATSTRNFKRVKGLEMTIYNKGNQQQATNEKAAETKPAEQPAQNTGDQQTQNPDENTADTKTAEQPAANAESEESKGTQIEKGATREPNQVRTSGPTSSEPNTANTEAQPAANTEQQSKTAESNEQQAQNNAKPAATNFKKGADVATVQFFLKATKPQTNLVCDGILGPKTITAIQQTTDINPTGKMDQKTQEEFNRLLAEAKQKVIPIQKQLGVTADGLIGKQTLAAMQKANMNIASVFNKKPTAPQTQVANTQGGNNANGAANQGNTNLLAIKFDEAKAQQYLKSKTISQKEYNIWKAFGIAPIYQKRYPKETQNQIAQILKETKKQQEANAQANTRKNTVPQQTAQQQSAQQKAGQQNALKEDVAVKSPDKTSPKGTKENPTTEYVSGTVSLMNMPKDEKKVYDEEYQKSLKANLKPGKNEQIAMDTADLDAKTAVLRYRQRKAKKTS